MSLSKVLEVARADLGYTENPPGSNRTKYWDAYGPKMQGQPWCVCFLWWVFQQAGERMAFFGGGKTASCGTLLMWYQNMGQTVDVTDIKVGDIVILNFSGTKDTQHCGLVYEVVRDSYGKLVGVRTYEGNTSPSDGSQSNGGMVCDKDRLKRYIVAVCRPPYKPDDPQPVDDVTGHWFTPSVEWAREKGLIKNYPDGSFKPNQPITRAEACVMLERFYQLLWEDDMR